MKRVSAVLFALAGVVHLLPVAGVASAATLERLYGVALADPSLVILMRHRAVLFGIVGALLFGAALRPALRPIAAAAGLVSMLSFVAIAWLEGGASAELARVVRVDLVASALLVTGVFAGRRG